ncbi:hypothetical protein H9L14_02825 [Sphingomonas sediminicola]|uniref:Glycosyltransferase RgtA/B/C/D-like domain-containing protein n=2 Tax=Sphingomonas sediminicola TaxID=386874 RepID=A0ABX6TB62_9SPHN|nr:hypothetical protein [Sphingomonas sediminicola]QNP46197.1 hypothetical protein H9L14_02825 [Sphingomonas sediminicola]
MYAWLRETAKSPLLGALLFMAMPYHVLDFYGRGALAEFTAIALIPLVALGVKRAAEGRFVLGAIAYAAMILTHVPLALLASIFLIAPYAVWLCWKEPRKLLRVAIPVTLGILLSAIFLLPAVLLEPYRDTANLWRLATFNPESWSLWAWGAPGPNPDMRSAVAAVMLILIMPIVVLLFTTERVRGAYAAIMLVLAAGLIPASGPCPSCTRSSFHSACSPSPSSRSRRVLPTSFSRECSSRPRSFRSSFRPPCSSRCIPTVRK